MKTEEAKGKLIEYLTGIDETTIQEINYKTQIPMVQIHGIISNLKEVDSIELEVREKKKYVKLIEDIHQGKRSVHKLSLTLIFRSR